MLSLWCTDANVTFIRRLVFFLVLISKISGQNLNFKLKLIFLNFTIDQLNNGTRLEELGYGYKVDIFDFDPEKLKEGINKVLNDEKLKQKMIEASKRIQNNNGIEIVCNRLIEMAQKGEKKSNCKS